MEYASAVWDLYLRKDIKQIEDVQKFALKVCTKNWGTSYNFLLSNCNLNTMADRRNTSRLCILFKIVSDISYSNLVTTSRGAGTPHSLLLALTVKHSYFPRTLSRWNTLTFDTSNLTPVIYRMLDSKGN